MSSGAEERDLVRPRVVADLVRLDRAVREEVSGPRNACATPVPGGRPMIDPRRTGCSSSPSRQAPLSVEHDEELFLGAMAVRGQLSFPSGTTSCRIPVRTAPASCIEGALDARTITLFPLLSLGVLDADDVLRPRPGRPSSSGSDCASTSQGSSVRPSTQGQPKRIALDRGNQPSLSWVPGAVDQDVEPVRVGRSVCPRGRRDGRCSPRDGARRPARPATTGLNRPARTRSPRRRRGSGEGSRVLPGSIRTRLTPIPCSRLASPRRCQLAAISPFSRRDASTSSQ